VAGRLQPLGPFLGEVRRCCTSSRGCWVRRSASSCCFSFCPVT